MCSCLIYTWHTHTNTHTFIHTFLHIGRIRNTFSWVCEPALHTKKHLGTGLVGLQRIHICPVQAIGIQSFTLSNATKREQSQAALFLCVGSTFMRGGSFAEPTMRPWIHIYTVRPGGSHWRRREHRSGFEVPGGWTDRWMDGRRDRETDRGMLRWWSRGRVLQLLPLVIVGGPFLHSTSTKQIWRRPFRVERELSMWTILTPFSGFS